MRTKVTAVLVAHAGGEWLDQTIAGIAAQTRAPAAVIAVNNGGSQRVAEHLLAGGAQGVVGIGSRVSFGQAVRQAVQAIPVEGDPSKEWIWLLSEDSCPEPEALEHILNRVQRAPSVVVAGPKLVDWDRPERIIELGQSLTRYGARWTLRRQELDQQQYDHMQDVLGVGPVGMLVRRDVWEQLGGFDPAFAVYDDALDFCVRARLAGHRVEVAPESRVRFAQSGVAGPRIDRKRSVLRSAHRQARTAHLYRRIAYAPAFVAFFEWLGLPFYALFRVLWALIREQPGFMIGEFLSAFTVFFTPHTILASRRRLKQNSTAGWPAIRQLRVDPKSVRTARMIDREAILASNGLQPKELHFISTGGLAVLSASAVIAIALTWWAFSFTSLTGGDLAPLSPLDQLWQNTHPIDGVPADPFTWVLALLGTLTFWNPSLIIVLLMVAAIPLTALGSWIWAAQLTDSKAGRALAGLGFAISPVLLGSISGGHLPTLVLTVVLPWLLLAATRCRESWSWAGTASLLIAVALAAAPILIPAALVLLIVGLFSTLRGIGRVLTTAIVPVVLFTPKLVTCILNGRPLDILLDPGINAPFTPGSTWHMLLGFPTFGLEGWAGILDTIGLGGPPATLLVGALMAPLALLALLGLFTGRIIVTVMSALLGGLGMLTALAAAQLNLTTLGNESIALWTGSGLAVYWIALLGLAAVGAETLRRAATPIVSVALVGMLVAVLPMASQLFLNNTIFRDGSTQMPALVQAAGEANPGIRTLVLAAEGPHSVSAEFVTGAGLRLDQIRTAETVPTATAADKELAQLVAGLASVGGSDVSDALKQQNVGHVLLRDGGNDTERAQLQRVFDQHSSLKSAGQTEQGLLWRVVDIAPQADSDGDLTTNLGGTSWSGQTIWAIQLIVVLGMLLLALPTGEVTYRPERRKRASRWGRRKQASIATLTVVAPGAAQDPEPLAGVGEVEGDAADPELPADAVQSVEPAQPADPAAPMPDPASVPDPAPAPDPEPPTDPAQPPTLGEER